MDFQAKLDVPHLEVVGKRPSNRHPTLCGLTDTFEATGFISKKRREKKI
jgi:hypothetical protein